MSRDERRGRDREGHKHSEKERDRDRGDRDRDRDRGDRDRDRGDRERDRGDRERDRADRHRDRDRSERHREKERERERERERIREREREKLREREREQERERERGRERDRERPRDRDRNHDRGRGGRDGGFPRRSRSREGGSFYRRSTWRSDSRKPYRFDSPPRLDGTDETGTGTAAAFATVPGAAAALSGVLTGGATALAGVPGAAAGATVATAGVSPTVPGAAGLVQLDPATTKAARELYIGNLPPNVEVPQLLEFLNAAMAAVGGGVLPGPPAVKAWRSSDGHYAFVEFRTMEEASNAMQLNGLSCLGFNLRIGRPKTYPMELQHIVPAPTIPLLHPAGAVAGAVVSQITQSAQLHPGEVASVALNPKAALEAAQAAARAAQGQNGVEGRSGWCQHFSRVTDNCTSY